MTPETRSYHWTELLRQRFLTVLARTGSVRRAASAVEKSPRAAYNLRRRKDGVAFAAAWDEALLVARELLGDMILERALDPICEVRVPHPLTGRLRWRRADPLLGRGMGLALLSRLDRSYDRIMRDRRRAADERRIVCELRQKSGLSRDASGAARTRSVRSVNPLSTDARTLPSRSRSPTCVFGCPAARTTPS